MSESKRIVILISGRGSNMLALVDACERGEVGGRVVRVISDKPAAGGLEAASGRGLETCVVEHPEGGDRARFEGMLEVACDEARPDLIALAGFMHILSAEFVRRFEGRILNIHPSLLPAYTGLDTHRRVLADGAAVHGCSVHFVTEALDAGPVIVQDSVDVLADDTPETLAARVIKREHLIYPYAAGLFCAGRIAMDGNACRLDGEPMAAPLCLSEV